LAQATSVDVFSIRLRICCSWAGMSKFRQLVVSGLSGPLCLVNAHASMRVLALKEVVEISTGIPVCEQRLLYGTVELHDWTEKLSSVVGDSEHVTLLRDSSTRIRGSRDILAEQKHWQRRIAKRVKFARTSGLQVSALFREFLVPHHIRGSRPIIEVAMRHDCETLRFASADIRADRDFILRLLKLVDHRSAHWLVYAAEEVRRDRSFLLNVARSYDRADVRCQQALEAAAPKLWSDRDFVLEVVEMVPVLIEKASADIRGDSGVMLAAIERSENVNEIIKSIPKQLFSDRNVALAVASRSLWVLPQVPAELRAEIHSALDDKQGIVHSASSAQRACRTAAVSRRVPGKRAPRAQRPASQQYVEDASDLQENIPFKELRAEQLDQQRLARARHVRHEGYRKSREGKTPGCLRPRKAVARSGKKQQWRAEFSEAFHDARPAPPREEDIYEDPLWPKQDPLQLQLDPLRLEWLHRVFEEGLASVEPKAFKELRAAQLCRQSRIRARRSRCEGYRKAREDARHGGWRPRKAVPRSARKQELLADF